jgi:hypothetical protein
MARRRMFSPDIVQQDNFLDMPSESQSLYFHLGLSADDSGFVSPKKVVNMVKATDDNLKILISKGFLIPFESGVVVITHWKQNNFIRKDRFIPSIYQKELRMLGCNQSVYQLTTSGQPTVNLVRKEEREKEGENSFEKGEEKNEEEQQNSEIEKEKIKKTMEEIRKNMNSIPTINYD